MLQYFLISEMIELGLILACVGVFYCRRAVLVPMIERAMQKFLGIDRLQADMYRREYKSLLHAKRLNSHLRRLNRLEGKPTRKTNEESDCDGRTDCFCGDCDCNYDDDSDCNCKEPLKFERYNWGSDE